MTRTANITETFFAGQIVKGIRCGTFVVLGSRTVAGEFGYQVKSVCPVTGRMERGEMFFTPNALKAA